MHYKKMEKFFPSFVSRSELMSKAQNEWNYKKKTKRKNDKRKCFSIK